MIDPIPVISNIRHPLADPAERVGFRVEGPLVPPTKRGFDWNALLDIALFSALFATGFAALYFRNELRGAVFGEILVNSGITPIVLATWALLSGSSMFRRQNLIKAASAGVLFSTGYTILNWEGELELFEWSGLQGIIGPALLELGFVFFIGKMFFLAEDAELQVERLENQLAAAKRSPGVGMACSYFYNFLLPTSANFNGIRTQFQSNNENFALVRGSRLLVFVPRTINAVDMKVQLREMQVSKKCFQAKPVEINPTHRPLFVFLFERDDEKKTCGYAFDIPTVISSCWDRARDSAKPDAIDSIAEEIIDFQNELQRLVSSHDITHERVSIVSIPPAPFDPIALAHLASQIE
jgi:hypothetical protein